jgi:hypothetical protein
MPQIYIILGSATKALFRDDEVGGLGEKLTFLVEEALCISGKNDAAFTAIRAVATENEADVQIEIRYTAGKDEYEWGEPFDLSEEQQKQIASIIKGGSFAFFKDKGLPEYSVSVWVKPYYKGVFVEG